MFSTDEKQKKSKQNKEQTVRQRRSTSKPQQRRGTIKSSILKITFVFSELACDNSNSFNLRNAAELSWGKISRGGFQVQKEKRKYIPCVYVQFWSYLSIVILYNHRYFRIKVEPLLTTLHYNKPVSILTNTSYKVHACEFEVCCCQNCMNSLEQAGLRTYFVLFKQMNVHLAIV